MAQEVPLPARFGPLLGTLPSLLAFLGAVLLLGLALPVPALADNDWMGIEVARPFDQGRCSLNIRIDESTRDLWGDGWATGDSNWYMVAPDGNILEQNLITIDTRLDWKVRTGLYLEADVPTVYSQLAPGYGGSTEYFQLESPDLAQSQGLGDVRLGLRGLFRDSLAAKGGADFGWNLSLVAPTGLGPFDAPQTLASTGEGRWQVLPGLVYGGDFGSMEGWVQGTGRVQIGEQVDASSQAVLDWRGNAVNGLGTDAGNIDMPGGGAWLAPRYGWDFVAGLAWIWYQDLNSRLSLAVEAKAHWLSPLTTGGGPLALLPESYYVLTPEMQARYGKFSVILGWQAGYIYATEEPLASSGDLLFDAAYTF